MRSGDLAYWFLWVLGTGLFFGCLAVTWWGLFGDRARGRRRCPRCWYDLSHSPGMRCAECGHTARAESHLFRTRRRILPALAAALAASLGASWALERAQQTGWVNMLPTTVLMTGLPLVGGAYGDLTAELSSRMNRNQLTDAQLSSLVQRCLKGDRSARPVTPDWERKYGTLLTRCRSIAPESLAINEDLVRLPARISIGTDRGWPRDAQMCLDLDVRDWWPDGTECRVHLEPQWPGSDPITLWRDASPPRRAGFGNQGRRRGYSLVIDPPSSSPAVFDVRLERMIPPVEDGEATWELVQEETISVDVELLGSIAEAIEPNIDEDLDRAVRATFSQGVVKWSSGRSPVRVSFNPRSTYQVADESTAVGASVDVLRNGTLARRLEIWWPTRPGANGNVGWVVAYEDEDLITGANAEDGQWQMRVRGDPAVSLRAGEPTKYWAGEFTVPLQVNLRNGVPDVKYWWREPVQQTVTAGPPAQ